MVLKKEHINPRSGLPWALGLVLVKDRWAMGGGTSGEAFRIGPNGSNYFVRGLLWEDTCRIDGMKIGKIPLFHMYGAGFRL